MVIPFLQWICKWLFGVFEREEFKKFLRMGLIFAFIIGSYWTLRVLKDAVFISLVSGTALPWAKTASLIFLFPLIMAYTKLLDKHSREKMFYILSSGYGLATIVFGVLLLLTQASPEVIAARTGMAWLGTKVLGYAWYVFVESYGSLIVALFWAFATDITGPESAKKGFALVVAIGQLGGIFGPKLIAGLPLYLGFETSAIALFVASFFILSVSLLVKYLLKATPKHLLESFHGKNETAVVEKEHEQEPGFFEGLRLLVGHKYLLGIFASLSIYEIIVTIFDFNFKQLAGTQYQGVALAKYLGDYGSAVNIVSLACLLLGISNITRFLGVSVAIALLPIIFAGAIFGFITIDSLSFLFWLMVCSKAINYALNGPAMKQLYIPTTKDVRFKAQAWMETFGSRGAKEAGSIFNMLLAPFQKSFGVVAGRAHYIALSGYLGFGLVALWFFVALFLGKTYRKAIEQKKVIC